MIRCSSIALIMTEPRSKSETWSETAKGAMRETMRENLFGVRKQLDDVRAIQKGRACEDAGIQLYNDVFLYDLKKIESDGRRSNGIITGEPDLVAASSKKGVDIKVSWSLLTFPLTSEMCDKKGYEWQARGYMCLFDLPVWEIAYCAIDTPEHILRDYDDRSIHILDDSIPMHHRITICRYERDAEIEAKMLAKCKAANEWIEKETALFIAEHNGYIY